jgi:hypothetical protein
MLEVILFKLEKSRMYLFANNEEFEDFIKDLDTNKFQLTIRPQGFYGTEKNCDDGDNVRHGMIIFHSKLNGNSLIFYSRLLSYYSLKTNAIWK